MRADRLVAILMLLQKNGRTTADSLAMELEVSERTIYRDIDALSSSGVPVYAQRGPGGGISLLDSYRTDLTGMTTAELQALMTLHVPAPLLDLGIGADLSSALRKLAAAVPGVRQGTSSRIQERFLIDSSQWIGAVIPESLFETIRSAVWDNRELTVSYYSELGSRAGNHSAILQPLGLVAAAGKWYLVAVREEHTIVIPLAMILSASFAADNFQWPAEFNLEAFWQAQAVVKQQQRPSFVIEADIKDSLLPFVSERLLGVPETTPGEARTRVTLRFETFEHARSWTLGRGNAVEIVAPLSLRLSVKDHARQILALYESA